MSRKRQVSYDIPNEDQESESDWEAAIELCEEILAELADLPDRAADFSEGVEERVTSIQEWIEDNQHVTSNMEEALQNIMSGVLKWKR